MRAEGFFQIERPILGLEFSYEFEKDERTTPSGNSKSTTMTFSEKADIETEGWVYHPGLVIYTLRLSPEWEQMSEDNNTGEKEKSRTFLQGYSTEFTFLQYKPYTLRIFADRDRSTLKSSLARNSTTESDTYGASLRLKYMVLPTTLDYNHLKSIQTGFYTSDNEADEFNLAVDNSDMGDTSLRASYMDNSQTTSGILIKTVQQTASLQNNYNFAEDKRVPLSSSISYRNTRSDSTKNTQYSLLENLLWQHKKNLTTNYSFRYGITDYEETRSESRALQFNLTHLLYENLTTVADADVTSDRFTGGEEFAYGGGLDLNYRRRTPWGMLNINTGQNYKITKTDTTAEFIQAIDESVTLTTGSITLLANKHVVIDSIVVTDNTGVIVYLKDIDYRITEMDSSARISRISGGGIADGQEVLVDYKYLSNPACDYSTYGQSYGININFWSVWTIYYSFERSKQQVLSGIRPDSLIDDIINFAGTELEWKWSNTKLEFEDRETTNVPSTKWFVEETVTLKPSEKVFFSLTGNYSTTKFKDTLETERADNIRADMQVLTSRWSRFRMEGFRDSISGQSEKTVDTGILSVFEWFYGIWDGSLSYKFSHEKDRISSDIHKNHYLLFEVKKALF